MPASIPADASTRSRPDMLGMTPSQYRAGGTNEEIKFAVGQTSLGAILVASSKKGVAAILLGDDPDELVRDLQDRFPNAHLIGADRDYEALVARVVAFVEKPGIGLTFLSTCVVPPSSNVCGRRFMRFPSARPFPMPRSPDASALQRRYARSPVRAPQQTRGRHSLSPCSSQSTAHSPDMRGASNVSVILLDREGSRKT